MPLSNVSTPYDTFTDSVGEIISLGSVYVGAVNQDPQANPINVYWDSAGTILAAQPLQVVNGYIVRSGSPAQVFVNSDYSIRLYDSLGAVVYTFLAITAKSISGPAGGDLTGSYPNPTIAANAVVTSKIADKAISNAKINPGASGTIKGTSGTSVVDFNAYDLNGLLGRVGVIERFSYAGFDTNLYAWCNGQTLSRTTDARLFAKISALIGTQGALGWGAGDGSTTFALPDYRGMFDRAFSNVNGVDPHGASRTIGDKQDDALQNITGTVGSVFTNAQAGAFALTGSSGQFSAAGATAYGVNFDASRVARTDVETRPINTTTYWCVVR